MKMKILLANRQTTNSEGSHERKKEEKKKKTAKQSCGLEERTTEYITEMFNPKPASKI